MIPLATTQTQRSVQLLVPISQRSVPSEDSEWPRPQGSGSAFRKGNAQGPTSYVTTQGGPLVTASQSQAARFGQPQADVHI